MVDEIEIKELRQKVKTLERALGIDPDKRKVKVTEIRLGKTSITLFSKVEYAGDRDSWQIKG